MVFLYLGICLLGNFSRCLQNTYVKDKRFLNLRGFPAFPVVRIIFGFCWLGLPNPSPPRRIWQSCEAITGIAGGFSKTIERKRKVRYNYFTKGKNSFQG
jgi:hypothetical protein